MITLKGYAEYSCSFTFSNDVDSLLLGTLITACVHYRKGISCYTVLYNTTMLVNQRLSSVTVAVCSRDLWSNFNIRIFVRDNVEIFF